MRSLFSASEKVIVKLREVLHSIHFMQAFESTKRYVYISASYFFGIWARTLLRHVFIFLLSTQRASSRHFPRRKWHVLVSFWRGWCLKMSLHLYIYPILLFTMRGQARTLAATPPILFRVNRARLASQFWFFCVVSGGHAGFFVFFFTDHHFGSFLATSKPF